MLTEPSGLFQHIQGNNQIDMDKLSINAGWGNIGISRYRIKYAWNQVDSSTVRNHVVLGTLLPNPNSALAVMIVSASYDARSGEGICRICDRILVFSCSYSMSALGQ